MRKELSIRLMIPVLLLTFLFPFSTLMAVEQFLDIDLTAVTIDETRGIAPSPFHLSLDPAAEEFYISIMTLNSLNGAQMGERLRFKPHFPLAHDPDGTPIMAGDWETISLLITPDMYGDATCATEFPGSEFGDGLPRLYIGTEDGYIFWLVETVESGIVVEGAFTYSGGPIVDLEPIPQFGYIALGALMDNAIYGFVPGTRKGNSESRYMYNFRLLDPRTPPMTDFDVIGPNDEQLPGPDFQVDLIIANGTGELGMTSISAEQTDDFTMEIRPDTKEFNIQKIASGSLMMLPSDGSTVLYDPHFSSEDGSSGCELELIGHPPEPCHAICGDVDNDGLINILDIVYLINYKYKDGPAPHIYELGDVDGLDPINILDIVYLINNIYKDGADLLCR